MGPLGPGQPEEAWVGAALGLQGPAWPEEALALDQASTPLNAPQRPRRTKIKIRNESMDITIFTNPMAIKRIRNTMNNSMPTI